MTIQVNGVPSEVSKMFNDEDVCTIRDSFCKDATPSEFKVFMYICETTKLNPMLKQIYFTKKAGRMAAITSIDGHRLIADRTGKYMPGQDTSFKYDNAGKLFSATAYVKKLGPDKTWHEIAVTAIFSEYKGMGVWDTKPHVMLSKAAESLAIRKAFPAELSSVYTKEEMDAEVQVNHLTGEIKGTEQSKTEEIPVEAITKDMANQMERDIDILITPVDPEYKAKALKTYQVASFEHMTYEKHQRLKRNMDLKIASIRQKAAEVPVLETKPEEDFDGVPF
jgi:phage recombination protein Bet